MENMLSTEEGKNWLVLVFESPISILEIILMECFDLLEMKADVAQIPHYIIRNKTTLTEVVVSLRILCDEENSKLIESPIREILIKHGLNEKFVFNPEANNKYYKFHKWIKPEERNENWNRDQCEILNELSTLCISLMKKGLFFKSKKSCSREHSLHLFAHMLGLFEFQRTYWELLIENYPPRLVGDFYQCDKYRQDEQEITARIYNVTSEEIQPILSNPVCIPYPKNVVK